MTKRLIPTLLMSLLLINGCSKQKEAYEIYLDFNKKDNITIKVSEDYRVLNIEDNTENKILNNYKNKKELLDVVISNIFNGEEEYNLLLTHKKDENNISLNYVVKGLKDKKYRLFYNQSENNIENYETSKKIFAEKINNFYEFNNIDDISNLSISEYCYLYNNLSIFSKDELKLYTNLDKNTPKIDYESILNKLKVELNLQNVDYYSIYPNINEKGIFYICELVYNDTYYCYEYDLSRFNLIISHPYTLFNFEDIYEPFTSNLKEKEEVVVNKVANEVLGDKYREYRSYIYDKLLYDGESKPTSKKILYENEIYDHIIKKLDLDKNQIKYYSIKYDTYKVINKYYIVNLIYTNNTHYTVIGDAFNYFVMEAEINGQKLENIDYEVTCQKFGINEFINQTHSGKF